LAQFEREVTGERIRDKIAASKKKGMWRGGNVPLGYEAKERKLHVVEAEARIIKRLYELYLELGNVRRVKEEADRTGLTTRSTAMGAGSPFSRGHIYKILSNPLYAGRVAHHGQVYDGQHAPIIPADLWTRVQRELQDRAVKARSRPGAKEPSPLAGILFDHTRDRLTPSHAVKKGRRYRYYIANRLIREKKNADALRLPAAEIEGAITGIVLDLLNDQRRMFEVLDASQTGLAEESLRQAQRLREDLSKLGIHEQLLKIKPALDRIVVGPDNLTISIGIAHLRALLMGESARSRPSHNNEQMPGSLAIEVPFTVRRRGREMRLILNSSQRATRAADKSLIGLVARGYAWRHEIVNGTAASATVIAQREKLTPAYVSRLIDLSFLAPDILAGIVSGEAPADLTASKLQSISNIPLDWPSQRSLLGFG
jgi:site-specific DNA recombinase